MTKKSHTLTVEQVNPQYVIVHVNGIELWVTVDEEGVSASFSTGEEASHDFS